jgi:hypothetical protein
MQNSKQIAIVQLRNDIYKEFSNYSLLSWLFLNLSKWLSLSSYSLICCSLFISYEKLISSFIILVYSIFLCIYPFMPYSAFFFVFHFLKVSNFTIVMWVFHESETVEQRSWAGRSRFILKFMAY